MRKLINSMLVSLDGYIEDKTRELEWATVDEELHQVIHEQERGHGAHPYGYRLHETMAA